MHRQTALKKIKIKFKGSFKNSDYLSKYGFYLPSGIETTKKDIRFIVNCVKKITNKLNF